MNLKAVIFDLDGTVLDNEAAYNKAFNAVLASLGVDTSKPIPHTPGVGLKANWTNLISQLGLDASLDISRLGLQTQVEYQKYINQVHVRDGFTILADELKRNKVKLALATSNDIDMANRVMSKFVLTRYFDAVVTISEVSHPKPHPEIFLLAAQKLNVEPQNVIVIEDAVAGVEAAKKAGMKAVWLSQSAGSCGQDVKTRFFYELNYHNLKNLI